MDKISSSFLDKLIKTVRSFNLLAWGERVVVAVSGGVDSSVLLFSLYQLRHYFGISPACASFDHKIRSDSGQDVIFVKDICKNLSIPFFSGSGDVKLYAKENKLNLEESARILRYNFLLKTARDFHAEKIAVAHHSDDFAENVIMRLITGSGAGAISGFQAKSGQVVRPLINHSKSEILEFADKNSIKFTEDYTNKDTKILRNFVRLNILPSFKAVNPSFLNTVRNTAEILKKDDDFIGKISLKIFKDIAEPINNGKIYFKKKDLSGLDEPVLYRILKFSVLEIYKSIPENKNNFFIKKPIIYYNKFKAFVELIKSEKPNAFFYIGNLIELGNEYDKIFIGYTASAGSLRFKSVEFNPAESVKNRESGAALRYNYNKYEYIIKKMQSPLKTVLKIKEINKTFYIENVNASRGDEIINRIINKEFIFEPDSVYFDYDKLSFPVTVRNFKEGDRFIPLGMKGVKKLKEYFIDKKVPVKIRKIIPIVMFGGNIVWVSLNEISDDIKITEFTKNVGIMRIE
ncbi:MAG: tRNA lysidine(34) synthetase TilS [Candidatus Acidulodesulfobacterium sp.]